MRYETETYRAHTPRQRAALPRLWENVKSVFAGFLELLPHREIQAAQIAAGREPTPVRLPREEREGLREMLHLVEQQVRAHIIVQALTFLMMTPKGQAMLRAAPRFMPLQPRPRRSTIIPHPGRHTIAQRWRGEPGRRRPEPQSEPQPEPLAEPQAASSAPKRPRKPTLDVLEAMLREGGAMTIKPQASAATPAPRVSSRPADHGPARTGCTFEQRAEIRIKALQRAFDDTAALVRRTARRLVKLAAERLAALRIAGWRLPRIDAANTDLTDLAEAFANTCRAYVAHLEPG